MRKKYILILNKFLKGNFLNAFKNKYALLLLIILLGTFNNYSQTVTIGSGTNLGRKLPVVPYFGYSFTEQIIPKAEINTAGLITKIRFYRTDKALTNSNEWTIYFGHTTKTTFTSNTDWILSSAMTQVYSGTVPATVTAGWIEIILTSPFNYNNTDNLVVAIDENKTGYDSDVDYFRIFTPTAPSSTTNSGIYYDSDLTNPDPASINLTGVRTNYRNQIQLEFTAVTPCVAPIAQPTALSLIAGGTTISGSFTASASANGYLVIRTTSATAPTNPTSGTAYVAGTTALGGTIVQSSSATTFTNSGLSPLTQYWYWVFAYSTGCIGQPSYLTANALSGNATTTLNYCTPTDGSGSTSYYLNGISTTGGITNLAYTASSYTAYVNNSATTFSAFPGTTINTSLSSSAADGYWYAWVDWNNNGVLTDAGENPIAITTYTNSPYNGGAITVPPGQAPGNYRVRFNTDYIYSSTPCIGGAYGNYVDFTLIVLTPAPCVTPTAQPTALSLSVSGTTINGSFTAASPVPNNYLVVVSTSATPPTPANGTTYLIGGTVGAGYTVADTDGNTTFSATGLSPSTLYYIYVFSYNAACTGGPLYYTTSPLSASATTLTASYCEPTSWDPGGLYIDKVAFVGAITDPPVNISTYGTSGFQNFTNLPNKAIQAQGEGINVIASAQGNELPRGTWKAWVDWNNNGTFEPATEEVYNILGFAGSDATFGFVIPLTTIPGDYRIRIRVNNGIDTWDYSETFGFNFSPCAPFEYIAPYDSWIEDYGETEDYLFTVVAKCNSLITEVTDGSRCGNGTVALGAKATAGVTQFRWYTAAVGGSYSTSVPAGIATTFTTPSLSATTNYYVTSWNGSCESQVRTLVTAKINPTAVVAFTPATPIVCGDDAILQLTAGGDKEVIYLVNEDFESGSLGVFENINNDSNNGTIKANTSWKNITSTYVPSTTNVWFPAISSGFGTNKFALAYSDSNPYPTSTIENSITLTNSVSTNTFLNLTLKLKLYYSRYYPDGVTYPSNDEYVNIELSTDGGSTYPVVLQSFITDIGIGTKFSELSYNLSAYINQPTLKIRIRHRSFAGGGWLPDGVAIDDIELFGDKPLNTAFNYNTAIVSAFTDAAALIPYVSGTLANTIFIRPTTTQLENTSFSIPVAATLSNGCSATGSVVIVNNTKMFVAGTPDADWNTASNWRPSGVPTASNCVVIFDNDVNITNPSFNALAQSLTIKPTGNLNLGTGRSLTVTDVVKVETNGVFELENNSSLVQKNNVPNSGKVTYRRIANIRKLDYVYWSSPLTSLSNFSSATISTGTPANAIYKWTPTIGSNINGFGNWASGVENMVSGKGYLVRGPDSFGTTAAPLLAEFKGTPANGSFTTPIARGAYNGSDYNTLVSSTLGTKDDDNWNLIGNPYPSAIKAIDFLTLNTNIDGFVQIWTHGTSPNTTIADPFYDNFVYNYSVGDYITYNKTGTSTGPSVGGPYPYDGFIPAGQGFFVLMNHTAPTPATVTFMNTMRSSAHNNSQFFRNATDVVNDESEGRIWLDLIAANGDNIRTLVGYIEEATNERDRLFDAIADRKVNLDLYSTIGEDQMRIQGRMLPFDDSDRVPLGMKVPQDGTYSIAIAFVEGLFAHDGQNIYLKDIQNGVIHDLSAGPYHFNAATGEQNDRFEIVYRDGTLAADDFAQTETIKVMVKNEVSIVSSETMQEVVVYNVVGQILDRYSNIAANTITLTTLQQTQKTLLLKIKLNNGKTVTRKIIF